MIDRLRSRTDVLAEFRISLHIGSGQHLFSAKLSERMLLSNAAHQPGAIEQHLDIFWSRKIVGLNAEEPPRICSAQLDISTTARTDECRPKGEAMLAGRKFVMIENNERQEMNLQIRQRKVGIRANETAGLGGVRSQRAVSSKKVSEEMDLLVSIGERNRL